MLLNRRILLSILAVVGLAPNARANEPGKIQFSDLYDNSDGSGIRISATLKALEGKTVIMRGYMAPPLRPESNFFVLTRFPMSVCPFCSSEADWPADIVVVYLSAAAQALSPSQLIHISGRLEIGAKMDPDTAFVSLVRVTDAHWEVA